MTQNIRMILTPLLMISYIFGLRIANLPIGHVKLWFSFLYMLVIWVIYCFFLTSLLIPSFLKFYSNEYHICYLLELFTTLLLIVFGVYHNKKFRNFLKKLDIVDNTLFKLGTVTDYNKLHTKILWLILGWFMVVILMNCSTALYVYAEYDCDILTAIIFMFLLNYSFHINLIDDLITASIIGYIGLKFDQINEHLQNLLNNNKHCEKSMVHIHIPIRRKFVKVLGNKCIIWIVIHLYLELHKISREVDSTFGTQMTFKMACYFTWIVIDLRLIFSAILIDNYVKSNKFVCAVLYSLWFSHNIYKFLLINYVCEIVSTKAKATGDLINRLSYSTCDIEVREIISQFSSRIIFAPLKFCGIGFFQFGFKFLYKFIMSIATVLVIILQAHTNK